MGTIVVIVVVVLVFLLLGLTTEFVTGVWRRIQLYGGSGVGVGLLIVAILFMGLLIVSSGTDTPDSALEQREAEEGAAGEAQRDPQPEPEPEPEPEPVELEFSGIGPQASEQFDLSAGLVRFELTHQGESNFSAYLLDETGEEDLIVSEIGPVEVSQAVQVPEDGTYLLNVNSADGAWTIRVLQ